MPIDFSGIVLGFIALWFIVKLSDRLLAHQIESDREISKLKATNKYLEQLMLNHSQQLDVLYKKIKQMDAASDTEQSKLPERKAPPPPPPPPARIVGR